MYKKRVFLFSNISALSLRTVFLKKLFSRGLLLQIGLLCLVSMFSVNVLASEASAELKGKLDAFTSLSANFEQRVISQDSQLLDQLSGRFYLQRPGKFKWHYANNEQEIISDGQKIHFLMTDLEQVIVRDYAEALSTVPSLVLVSDSSRLDELFEIKKNKSRNGIFQYELRPKSIDSAYESLLVSFVDDKLLGLRMIDGLGQTTEIILSDVINNPIITENEFDLIIPDGYDVIGENGAG